MARRQLYVDDMYGNNRFKPATREKRNESKPSYTPRPRRLRDISEMYGGQLKNASIRQVTRSAHEQRRRDIRSAFGMSNG